MSKTLIYDGDCSFCIWISECFERLRVVDAGHRRPYQAYSGELAERIEAAGIRNEMLVLDEASSELRPGIAGFLWLLCDSRYRAFAGVLALGPIRGLMRLLYRTIAYNRRIVAPPARGIVCACDPDPHAGFQALFWVTVGAINVGAAALFGHATSRAWLAVDPVPAALLLVLFWPAVALAARVASPLPAARVVTQSAMAFTVGALSVIPLLALSLLAGGAAARAMVVLALVVGGWRLLVSFKRRLVW
jgi:hypothetical protein